MSKSNVLVLLVAMGLTTASFAQTTKKATTTTTPAVESKSTEGVDEADQLITNRRLRASSGSLSKWSAALFFDYSGGSVADPLRADRPNIIAGGENLLLQNLTSSIGVRYRATTKDSFSLSIGGFMSTPFHDKGARVNDENKKGFKKHNRELTFSDPALGYTHLDNFAGWQSVTSVSYTYITNSEQDKAGYNSSFYIGQTFMREVGNTGFSYGAAATWTRYFHDKKGDQVKNTIGLFPAAEYVINDTFNLRTVFGWQYYGQSREQAKDDVWTKRKVYQSVGLGISVTRDIYLYPNIQFIPSDIRSDRTNIAISANINVF
ncbi:MAG: hypothetical protein WCY48_06385 [Candidatus Caldatribacteriota bacterium]